MNRNFCNTFYSVRDIELRYKCYNTIGLSGDYDRDFCELKYDKEYLKKNPECLDKINELTYLRTCSMSSAEDCLPDDEALYLQRGIDYCFSQYLW